LRPADAAAHFNRGNAYAAVGAYEHAIHDFDQAIDLAPDQSLPYFSRGLAYYRTGKCQLAIGDFDQAIKLKRDFAQA
jgi:tetratricopeptide (TPR) repeat protein